jgi:hypothetical protein
MYCGQPLPAGGETKPEEKAPARIDIAEKIQGAVSKERIFLVVSPLQSEPGDDLVKALSELMGWELYLSRMKLRSVAPYILAGSGDPQTLQELLSGLIRIGIDAFLIKETGLDRLASKQIAHSAALEPDKIIFRLEDDSSKAFLFSELLLLVRGRIRTGPEFKNKLGKLEVPDLGMNDGDIFNNMIKSRRERRKKKPPAGFKEPSETGTEVEVLDIYSASEHAAVRVIESEFDFTGMFGPGFQPRLLGVKKFLELLRTSAPGMVVDDNFIRAGYNYREKPVDQKQALRFVQSGMAKTRAKLHSSQASFTEYSSLVYLYCLRRKMAAAKKDAPSS